MLLLHTTTTATTTTTTTTTTNTTTTIVGRDSSVGIATRYGLDGPGIESVWGRDFPHPSWGPPSLLYNGYRVFRGG